MTIVLQHQFWGLDVGEEAFGVTLSFSDVPERLTIPFSAVSAFADPSVRFGLQFDSSQAEDGGVVAPAPAAEQRQTPVRPVAADGEGEAGTAERATEDGSEAAGRRAGWPRWHRWQSHHARPLPQEIAVPSAVMANPRFLFDGPENAPVDLVLAHGAGAPMDSPFMDHVARGLGARGLRVARFEFPYMAAHRADGRKRPPDRAPALLAAWREVIAELGRPGARLGGRPGGRPGRDRPLAIGGKSLGGRMASMIAAERALGAVVCLGYPFHPPGRPDKLRTAHLESLATPCLIVQGERDPFGRRGEVEGYPLSAAIRIAWCPDGDHSLVPRKSSGRTAEQNWGPGRRGGRRVRRAPGAVTAP